MRYRKGLQSMPPLLAVGTTFLGILVLVWSLLLPVAPAMAQQGPILHLTVTLDPSTPNPIPAGEPFTLRLTYECSSSFAGDQCENMQVTSQLPAGIDFLALVGNSDTQVWSYDPATQTATWIFNSPLPLGTTGQLELEVRFTPGTTEDGEGATIVAEIEADGTTPVQSDPITVTPEASDKSTVTKTVVSGGASGDVTTYAINVCSGGVGSLNLTNATIVDTLPVGAEFVSASPAETSVTTDPVTGRQVVTWTGVEVQAPGCERFTVTVLYDDADAANAIGAAKENEVSVTGTPHGGTEKTMDTSIPHTLEAPDPGFALSKTADADTIIGGVVETRLRVENTGNVQLNNVVVDDPIPAEYDVTRINTGPATAVWYQKNGDNTWIPGVPLGTNVAVTSFPGFGGSDYISNLRFEIGSIPVAYNNNEIAIFSTVVNPPNGGSTNYSLPRNVTNTATMRGTFDGNPLADSTESATTEIDVPKARPQPQKTVVSGSPALPGQTIKYRVTLANGNFLPLDEPVIADLLPNTVEYVPGSWTLVSNISGCMTQPTFTQVDNVGGTGRTMLTWSWAGSGCEIPSGDSAVIEFSVKVKQGTYPGSISNRIALVDSATDVSLIRRNYCATVPTTESNLFVGQGYNLNELCFSPPSSASINAAASISSAKLVQGQLDSYFHRDPEVGATVQGGLITYQKVLTNTGNVDFQSLVIVDILPYYDPVTGESNVGVRDQAELGTTWTPQLAGPVVVDPPIAGLTIRYSTETDPCRPGIASNSAGCVPMVDGVSPGPGVWSTQLPTDPTAVRSLKFDFGSYVLKANEEVRFAFPMFAPDDAPIATAGPDGVFGTNDDTNVAWNSFAYEAVRADDGTKLVAQPPRVGIIVQPLPAGLASYGNYVWNDVNQNGIQDEPAHRGINGVTVHLYQDADGNPATTNDQILIGTQITRNDASGNPGYYIFTALQPGNYFAEFVPPVDFVTTIQDAGADDELDSDINPATNRTVITELVSGEEDLTWDAGFHAPEVELGNRVWFDTNNDGIDNDGAGATLGSSAGASGVTVELFLDVNGDGRITGNEQYPIARETTDANGYYRFSRQTMVNGAALGTPEGLYPGQYFVGIAPSNFAPGGPLAGYYSSGTTINAAGVISEADAPDPDNDTDRDDNGNKVASNATFYTNGVLSKPVSVSYYNEPETEFGTRGTSVLTGDPIADAASNLTIDFGFYTTSIGNLVWDDNGAGGGVVANGTRDGSEPGVAGVEVRLFSSNGTQINVGPDGILGTADDSASPMITDANGNYQFSGLPEGNYIVRIVTPTGYVSTRDIATTSNPNNNVDNDDNGIGTASGTVASGSVTMAPGNTGSANNNTVTTNAGSTTNPTVDFGITRNYSLGNQVWRDDNNDGVINGSEVGISGVTVRLYLADGVTRASTIAGAQVADATTNAQGYYRFDNLPAGDYIVEVLSTNLTSPGVLNGMRTSTGATGTYEPAPDPDNNIDYDDNGTLTGSVVRSGIVSLGEGTGTQEPTGETAPNGQGAQDNQANMTVDFGFYPIYSLGNRVWDDRNNNGVLNLDELGIDGITVRLYSDADNDGVPDGAAIATTTTANGGYYLFTELLSGNYIVEIVAPSGYKSSTGYAVNAQTTYEPAPDPDNNIDSDDNGTTLSGQTIRSGTVTLSWGAEPTNDGTMPAAGGYTDAARNNNANYSVDFGIYRPMSLGNLVWRDDNNDGRVSSGEPGIEGVTVRIYVDSDNNGIPDDLTGNGSVTADDAIRTTTTNATGHYLFTDLGEGNYVVEVVTPAGMTSSTGLTINTSNSRPPYEGAPDPDDNRDDDDNGTNVGTGTVVRTATVELRLGTEPLGEPATPGLSDTNADNNANYTVDFGFYPALSLGNRVWFDRNNNGLIDAGETGISGVTVRLYRDLNNDGVPDDITDANFDGIPDNDGFNVNDAIATTTTNASGHYLFTNLNASHYIVEIVPPAGYRTSTGAMAVTGPYELAPDPDNDTDNDDNGSLVGTVIRSSSVTLTVDGEPTGETATTGITDATADNRSNLTVDFGLFQPVNLGDLIFEDVDANGTYDPAVDRVLPGAVVSLFFGDGTTPATDINGNPVGNQTTGADGLYNFTNLWPGDYVVTVTAPSGFISTTDTAGTDDPNSNTNNDDNGPGSGNSVTSGIVTVTGGQEPATGIDGDGTNGNLTVDFGFYHPVRVGNLIFLDRDNNGLYDPAVDAPLAGATVELFAADGTTAVTDINGNPVGPQTTTATGLYLFDNLVPGDYVVRVTGPADHYSSTDITSTPNPNGDLDNDDNGVGLGNVVSSNPITLRSSGEPNTPADGDDVHGNLTVDFGFYRPMRLGNFVFEDVENDGEFTPGDDQPIEGAEVRLFMANGTTPAVHADGSPVAMVTTDANGNYLFENLPPGQYRVQVTTPVGYHSSTDIASTANPNNDTDNDDNGVGSGNVAMSNAVTLIMESEPTNDGDDNQGNLTIDFGFYRAMRLGNFVFHDKENNGIYDGTDVAIPGATVELFFADGTTPATHYDGTPVTSVTTDANGHYLFDNLAPGEYRVRVTAPAGFRSSSDIASSSNVDNDTNNDDNGIGTANSAISNVVTLISGQEPDTAVDEDGRNGNLTVDFGFFYPVNVGNLVFFDRDNNGLYDPAIDQVLPGATVTLLPATGNGTVTDVDGNPVGPITTGADGLYNFGNLWPGTYRVQVEGPNGYLSSTDITSTTDPDGNLDNDDNGVGETQTVVSRPFTLTSGDEPATAVDGDGTNGNLTIDFGFFRPVNVGNLVFVDLLNDGSYNGADYPLSGATVTITTASGDPVTDINGNTVGSQTTGVDGLYSFENLYPGEYIITVVAPNGYISSSDITNQTDNPDTDIDNDDNGIGVTQTVSSGTVTLYSNEEPDTGVDGDGIDGNLTVDFGFYEPVRLGNLVFLDTANNGRYDAGIDSPLAGALVELFLADGTTPATHPDGSAVASQTTGADGLYLFDNLMPGDYVVRVTAPAGYISSTDITSTPNPNWDIDNDDNGIGSGNVVSSAIVSLVSQNEPDLIADGDNTNGNMTVDFGFFQPLSLGNLIFEDMANNGVYDAGTDQPIAGVTVSLYLSDGVTPAVDINGNTVTPVVTGANGEYEFTNLPPGEYVVTVTTPTGYVSSDDIASSANPDNDRDNDDNGVNVTATTVSSNVITLSSGDEPANGGFSNPTVDFGFYQPASLGDYVWLDINKDGVQDATESGVPGVTVNLYQPGPDGIIGTADDIFVGTTTTGANGEYLFDNLPAGSYYVEFDLPAGYAISPIDSSSATDATDSDADPITGRTIEIILNSGDNDLTWDAGIYYTASLGDRVWFDDNANGIQDAGETGVENVTVHLYDSNDNLISTTTTDTNGNYLFDNVPPGDYYVQFDIPSGYEVSPQDQGSDDSADSDVDPSTGRTIITNIAMNENDPTWDLGLYELVSLGNLVWSDVNNNGIVDASEQGIDNVSINLYRDTNNNGAIDAGEQVATTTTSGGGLYLFDQLIPGSYIVQIDPSNFANGAALQGYTSSTGSIGTNVSPAGPYEPAPATDSDINDDDNGNVTASQGIVASAVTLTSRGEPINDGDTDNNSNLTVDFGVFKPASLGTYVWYDTNENGQRDAGEAPVPNVTVTLYDAAGNPVATTTTDTNGAYLFTNLVPGTYSVGFSDLPNGYTFTNPDQGDDASDSDADPNTGLTIEVTLTPGEHNPTLYAGIIPIKPTAISLQSFAAQRSSKGVDLNWETIVEYNTRGFEIYRSENGQRSDAVKVSDSLITARGSASNGARYSWTDTSAASGTSYTYWLVEVELGGNSNWYGPATVQSQTSSANIIFLPFISR
jgi:uncharacterized repeat protein (TIGR01451 family)